MAERLLIGPSRAAGDSGKLVFKYGLGPELDLQPAKGMTVFYEPFLWIDRAAQCLDRRSWAKQA
jgi:hypothetical protein